MLGEGGHGLGHGGGLLADGHVDAAHVLAALVQDRVHCDGGLARLAVADDELALATADRDQRIDRLDPRLHRLVNRLAAGDPRGLHLHAAGLDRTEGALAVDGFAEGVHHPAQQRVAHRDREDVAGGPHGLALLDVVDLAEHHGADGVLVQVQGQSDGAVLELEHLVDRRARQAADAGDAVAHFHDATDLGLADLGGEAFEISTDRGGDVAGVECEGCHISPRTLHAVG